MDAPLERDRGCFFVEVGQHRRQGKSRDNRGADTVAMPYTPAPPPEIHENNLFFQRVAGSHAIGFMKPDCRGSLHRRHPRFVAFLRIREFSLLIHMVATCGTTLAICLGKTGTPGRRSSVRKTRPATGKAGSNRNTEAGGVEYRGKCKTRSRPHPSQGSRQSGSTTNHTQGANKKKKPDRRNHVRGPPFFWFPYGPDRLAGC